MVSGLRKLFAAGAAVAMLGAGTLHAEEAAPAAEAPVKNISAVFAIDYNTHFISYGADVWAQGDDWGGDATINPSAQITFADVLGPVDLFMGTWWDVNDNVDSAIGGQLQEVDVWFGASVDVDRFSLAVLYQDWIYGGDVEKILDFTIGFDDSDLLFDGFAFNPYVTVHNRLELGAAAGDEGTVIVVGIAPSFTLIDSETYPVTLTIPVASGFFLEDDFHGGTEDGFGYVSVGASLSVPLSFIPETYGAWELHGGVTYYHTDDDVIPNNPDEDFVTGNVGVSVSF